mmetsp:Transcript_25777/g.60217  ORF Transcript_25777/g.60217 Transcript_25777/m.60217 type:complete len:267 (+) Transcript_25777:1338-2138(+)
MQNYSSACTRHIALELGSKLVSPDRPYVTYVTVRLHLCEEIVKSIQFIVVSASLLGGVSLHVPLEKMKVLPSHILNSMNAVKLDLRIIVLIEVIDDSTCALADALTVSVVGKEVLRRHDDVSHLDVRTRAPTSLILLLEVQIAVEFLQDQGLRTCGFSHGFLWAELPVDRPVDDLHQHASLDVEAGLPADLLLQRLDGVGGRQTHLALHQADLGGAFRLRHGEDREVSPLVLQRQLHGEEGIEDNRLVAALRTARGGLHQASELIV